MKKVPNNFFYQKKPIRYGLAVRVHLRQGERQTGWMQFTTPVNFQEQVRMKKLLVDEIELTGQLTHSLPG
jgi:hypothetical protein